MSVFSDASKASMYYIEQYIVRNLYTPSPIHTVGMTPAERAAFFEKHAQLRDAALEELRLDYDVGPRLGPGRREFNATPLQRGRRAIKRAGGQPAGPYCHSWDGYWRRRGRPLSGARLAAAQALIAATRDAAARDRTVPEPAPATPPPAPVVAEPVPSAEDLQAWARVQRDPGEAVLLDAMEFGPGRMAPAPRVLPATPRE